MATTANPKGSAYLTPANVIDAFGDRYDLIVGQKTGAGTAVDGNMYDITDWDNATIQTFFGSDSELTQRIMMFRQANSGVSHLFVIAKTDPSVAAAKSTLTIGGPATEDNSFKIAIVDKYQYVVNVTVEDNDTDVAIATKIQTAINDIGAPVVATINAAIVTVTATNTGGVGDNYGIEIIGSLPAGVPIALTGFTGGGAYPVGYLTGIFDIVGEQIFQGISWPEHWYSDLQILEDFLETRFDVENNLLSGVGFYGYSGAYATVKAIVDASNSRVCYPIGNNIVDTAIKKGNAFLQPADYQVVYFMGIRSKRLTTGASISSDVIATTSQVTGIYAGFDTIGGAHTASKPYFNTELKYTAIAPSAEFFTEEEQVALEESGYSVVGVNRASNAVIMGPVVCPYKIDTLGNPNITYHFLNYIDTGNACREILMRLARIKYAQSRLTDEALKEGFEMENAESIKSHLLFVMRQLMDIALVRAGSKNEKYISDNTTVTIDLSIGRADVTTKLPIVTQLRAIIYTLQYSFNLGAGATITF